MRGDYASDRAWSDQFNDQVEAIIRALIVQPATVRRDMREATDLMVYVITNGPRKGQPVGAIAARLRDGTFWAKTIRSFATPIWWGLQFTIRSQRDSGTETELSKIKKGFGDWFFYGHVEQRQVRHWMTLDLEIFRRWEGRAASLEHANRDGTYFRAYDVRSFPDTIFIRVSPTMATAIEKGVDAVEPLPEPDNLTTIERVLGRKILNDPPDLHDWINRYGGYAKIPEEGWTDYRCAMAEWETRRGS